MTEEIKSLDRQIQAVEDKMFRCKDIYQQQDYSLELRRLRKKKQLLERKGSR